MLVIIISHNILTRECISRMTDDIYVLQEELMNSIINLLFCRLLFCLQKLYIVTLV